MKIKDIEELKKKTTFGNIVDFSNLLFKKENNNKINPKKHKLIILLHGLNEEYYQKISDDNFIKKMTHYTMSSLTPSTKISNMISFYKGTIPAIHGVLGRYQHHKESNASYDYITFVDRISKRSLEVYGLTLDDIYGSLLSDKIPKEKWITLVSSKKEIEYPYQYLWNHQNIITYNSIYDAFKKASNLTRFKNKSTNIILHISDLEIMRKNGATEEEILDWLDYFSTNLEKLKLKNKTLFLTSLYGGITPKGSILLNHTKYNKYFEALPNIEERFTSFFVKDGYISEFISEFEKDYEKYFELIETEKLINTNIFLSDKLNGEYGNYFSYPKKDYYFDLPINEKTYIQQLDDEEVKSFITGGISIEERLLPLLIYNEDNTN